LSPARPAWAWVGRAGAGLGWIGRTRIRLPPASKKPEKGLEVFYQLYVLIDIYSRFRPFLAANQNFDEQITTASFD
jgi:hypothetical protein